MTDRQPWAEPSEHLQQIPAPRWSRRAVLGAGAGLVGASITEHALARPRSPAAQAPGVKDADRGVARNLIFLVADGMSNGALAIGDYFQKYTTGQRSHWNRVARLPGVRSGLMSTYSANAVVTDSAAASAAWGTGVKHFNGQMGVDPEGRRHEPLLIRAKRNGKATGVVTTTTVTHATPAGFYCNVTSRASQAEIGVQLLDRGIDLALGGGAQFFAADLLAKHPGLSLANDAQSLRALDPRTIKGPVLGLFDRDHVRYAIERPSSEPSLAQTTRWALDRFTADADTRGFVLQVEAGRIDHAGHLNDAPSLLREQLEFDEVIDLCAQWTLARKDTLLIITTDHATANPSPTFYLRPGIDGLKRLAEGRISFESMFAKLVIKDEALAPEQKTAAITEQVKTGLSINLSAEAQAILTRHFEKERVDPFAARNVVECVLGGLLADHFGVAFISPNHTADHVPILAVGAGADRLPGFLDNTEVHGLVTKLLDLAPL